MQGFVSYSPGADGGPTAPDAYKKAVYRPAPTRFTAELLPPVKHGSSYHYPIRIWPSADADRMSVSSARTSNREYDVYRRWEDFLWFQESLELEYSRLARSKRRRLEKGKGIKRDGMYLQDQAASFESLPQGPDPNSVARDIHEVIPKLTKKATLFRANQATHNQRFSEITAFINAMFLEDVPALLRELREDRIVRDFFGLWRTDRDMLAKAQDQAKARMSMESFFTSGVYSSTPDLTASPSRVSTSTRGRNWSRPMSFSTASSPSSSSPSRSSAGGSSSGSSRGSTTSLTSSGYEDLPIAFGRDPQRHSFDSAYLESLPEDVEAHGMHKPARRRHTSAAERAPPRESWQSTASLSTLLEGLGLSLPEEDRDLRQRASVSSFATIMTTDSADAIIPAPWGGDRRDSGPGLEPLREDDESHSNASARFLSAANPRSARESWQSTASAATFLAGLNLTLPEESNGPRSRSSVASVATFRTTNSADAVMPRDARASIYDDECDTPFYAQFPRPPSPPSPSISITAETPRAANYPPHITTAPPSTPPSSTAHLYPAAPGSPTTSEFSVGTSASSSSSAPIKGPTIALKAVCGTSAILLRAPRNAPLADVRARIRAKFDGQEGIALSPNYALGVRAAGSVWTVDEAVWAVAVARSESGKLALVVEDASV